MRYRTPLPSWEREGPIAKRWEGEGVRPRDGFAQEHCYGSPAAARYDRRGESSLANAALPATHRFQVSATGIDRTIHRRFRLFLASARSRDRWRAACERGEAR